MSLDVAHRIVLEVVSRGDVPAGGPSELAARDLVEAAPARYWQRWSADAAERIREQTRSAPSVDIDEHDLESADEQPERQREPRPISDDARIAFAPACALCGRSRDRGEYFGGVYVDDEGRKVGPEDGRRVACCLRCHRQPLTERRAADLHARGIELRRELERGALSLAELSDVELLELAGPGAEFEDDHHAGDDQAHHLERDNDSHEVDPADEVADIVHCCLLGWQRVAGGEFCSSRPIRSGLRRVGLDDPGLLEAALERLGVERRRCGSGERWRLAP